jgi:hypothetical protein
MVAKQHITGEGLQSVFLFMMFEDKDRCVSAILSLSLSLQPSVGLGWRQDPGEDGL